MEYSELRKNIKTVTFRGKHERVYLICNIKYEVTNDENWLILKNNEFDKSKIWKTQ